MDDNPRKEDETTAQGAVEVDESELDQAAGGVSSGGDYNEQTATQWNGPVTLGGQKAVPENPAFSPHQGVTEKKI